MTRTSSRRSAATEVIQTDPRGSIDIEDPSVDANADVWCRVLNWSIKLSEIIENNQWKWLKWVVEMDPIEGATDTKIGSLKNQWEKKYVEK